MRVKHPKSSLTREATSRGTFSLLILLILGAGCTANAPDDWSAVPGVAMRGDLKIFWNVYDWTRENNRQAFAHGFQPISLVDPYSNRAGGAKESLNPFVNRNNHNPWVKPPHFERVIKGDIAPVADRGTFIHDIEIEFSTDAHKAWEDPAVRGLSGATNFADFEEAYYREWASWYTLPLKWLKELHPTTQVGLYGRQPFDRDYWGIANQSSAEIETKHRLDWELWKNIDPFVDVYVVSIYNFYALPDSVYYMASNVEQNFQRTRTLGKKPVLAYETMRYQARSEFGRELDPFLVEAMAIVPYFSGAKGVVLWGHEPDLKPDDGSPYRNLPLYTQTLARVAALSEEISRGTLVIDEPAHVLWKERRPLLRRFDVGANECVALAINPWQGDKAESEATTPCGDRTVSLRMTGKHATLAHISDGKVTLY